MKRGILGSVVVFSLFGVLACGGDDGGQSKDQNPATGDQTAPDGAVGAHNGSTGSGTYGGGFDFDASAGPGGFGTPDSHDGGVEVDAHDGGKARGPGHGKGGFDFDGGAFPGFGHDGGFKFPGVGEDGGFTFPVGPHHDGGIRNPGGPIARDAGHRVP